MREWKNTKVKEMERSRSWRETGKAQQSVFRALSAGSRRISRLLEDDPGSRWQELEC